MMEDGDISIFSHWPGQSLERSATDVTFEHEKPNLQPEWASARRRVELYLEALCVPEWQRPVLTDRAMALAWTKTTNNNSIPAAAMSALHTVLEEYDGEGDPPVPAGRGPSGAPLTHQRAMAPDRRALPQMHRSHMTPATASFSRCTKSVQHEEPASSSLPFRFIFPPGLEQYFF